MPMFKAQDVQKAFNAIRKDGIPTRFRKSRKWDIIEPATGAPFPPKAILFLAKQFAGDDSPSGGGGDVGTNNALRECGFRVILKLETRKNPDSVKSGLVFSTTYGFGKLGFRGYCGCPARI